MSSTTDHCLCSRIGGTKGTAYRLRCTGTRHRIVEDSARYAKAIVRCGSATDGPPSTGAFYRPNLIEVEDLRAPIIQQEISGPVATFEVFDDEADAIHWAKATEFGEATGAFTRGVDRASREINVGTVSTQHLVRNQQRLRRGRIQAVGYKRSGSAAYAASGSRES